MSNKVELVLLQSVKGLGNKDDIVSVALPYAKNVLLAQGKAKVADKAAIDAMKQKKEKAQKNEQEEKKLLDDVFTWVKAGGALKIKKKSAPNGHLYEKVSPREIQETLAADGVKVPAAWIVIQGKIEAIGEHSVNVEYKGKKAQIPVSVS